MTKGKPVPVIIGFFFPVLLGSLFQQAYNLADGMIVGKFIGMDEMGAVLSTGSLNFFVIEFIIGLTNGFCIPIAQAFGAGEISIMRRRTANALYLCGIFTVVLTALTMLFTRPLLIIMQTPAEMLDAAYSYIIVLFGGIAVIMFYNMFAGLLRALGDSRSPLYFLIIACIINVGLDLLFIIVFKMGTAGAAWATVAAQFCTVILCAAYLRKKYTILTFQKEELKFSIEHCKTLIKAGVPMALQTSITAVGIVIIQQAINKLGAVAVSAVGMANKFQVLVWQPMECFGITMATFCAQNLGARKIHRIKKGVKLSMLIIVGYSLLAGVFVWFFGRYTVMIFVNKDEPNLKEAIVFVTRYLKINGLFYWSIGILYIIRNSVQGLNYTLPAMFAGVCELVGRSVMAIVFVPLLGFDAVCIAGPLSWIMANILLIIVFADIIRKFPNRRVLRK